MSFLLGSDPAPEMKTRTVLHHEIPQVPDKIEDVLNEEETDEIPQSYLLQWPGVLTPENCVEHRSYLYIRLTLKNNREKR